MAIELNPGTENYHEQVDSFRKSYGSTLVKAAIEDDAEERARKFVVCSDLAQSLTRSAGEDAAHTTKLAGAILLLHEDKGKTRAALQAVHDRYAKHLLDRLASAAKFASAGDIRLLERACTAAETAMGNHPKADLKKHHERFRAEAKQLQADKQAAEAAASKLDYAEGLITRAQQDRIASASLDALHALNKKQLKSAATPK